MKFATILIIGLFITGFESTPIQEKNPVLGTWEMTIDAPGGGDTDELTFYEESGKLKVKNDKGTYKVTHSDNNYKWQMTKRTPMGDMELKVNASLDGEELSGTMEMMSGMAAGRVADFKATRK